MRTIKFRGKTVFGDRWVYGGILQSEKSGIYIIEPSVSIIDSKVNKIDPDTVGQFTGLTDKNGMEIYEGDIVSITLHYNNSCESSYNAVVKQTDGAFGFGNVNGFAPFYGRGNSEIKVIGNIHDNPELLEGGQQ